MRTAAAAAGLLLLAASLAPLHARAAGGAQLSGNLPHGGAYIVARDDTVGAAAIDLWFRAPGAGYDDASPGISRLAATAAAAAPLESGKSLVAFVRSLGGRFTISAYPDLIGVSAVVPAQSARRAIAALTSAYFAPAIDDNALKTAQRDMAVLGVQKRFSSDQLLHDALFAAAFPSGAAHYPPIPNSVPDLTKITLAQVSAFARRAFRSANGTLTLAGKVDPAFVDAVTAGSAGPPDAPIDPAVASAPQPSTVSGAVGGVGLAYIGPAIADQKSATAMDFIADYLFRDETGVVTKAIDANAESYVSAQFITLHNPGIMLVTIGGNDAANVQERVTQALQRMQQPLDQSTFAAAREAFLYHLASDSQTPQAQADNLGWYASEGNAAYAPSDTSSSYWKAAAALDPGFVATVVKRYLVRPVSVRLVTSPVKEKAT